MPDPFGRFILELNTEDKALLLAGHISNMASFVYVIVADAKGARHCEIISVGPCCRIMETIIPDVKSIIAVTRRIQKAGFDASCRAANLDPETFHYEYGVECFKNVSEFVQCSAQEIYERLQQERAAKDEAVAKGEASLSDILAAFKSKRNGGNTPRRDSEAED